MPEEQSQNSQFVVFNRDFLDPDTPLTFIGGGALGGKAHNLAFMRSILQSSINQEDFPGMTVGIPTLAVLRTDVFDAFIANNSLFDVACSGISDDRIAHAFQKADLPFEVLGDLRSLVEHARTPLAVRSSSLLEDSKQEPFAGIYNTKMIPNNQFSPDERFQKLVEAVKFVYASTFFKDARDYRRAIGHDDQDEKMAVIVQQVVGKTYQNRFYPECSGVARSYNYYPVNLAQPEDGVVNLALGLGKTIVDGGLTWIYSPVYPSAEPPFRSAEESLELTQTRFWCVNMGEPAEYNPSKETEYMVQGNLVDADNDGTLDNIASTYNHDSESLSMGVASPGPRVLNFAPLLRLNTIPLNPLIKKLLEICEQVLKSPVEMEFAVTFNPHRFNLLQVRAMVAPTGRFLVEENEMVGENVLAASRTALGNGAEDTITHIVYVKPNAFNLSVSEAVVPELEQINHKMLAEGKPYVLVVLGRLGTNIPWLGIPAGWGQVSGARVIVEAAQEMVNVELSQGSHYFHNIINLGVKYFCMPVSNIYNVDWNWLDDQTVVDECEYLRHIELPRPLRIRVDGQSGRGVIYKS